uniref:LRRNT domain-containing protein n=1 Tax=Salvator merianae TaxID=96440 RepID=A0A8D0B0Q0_SALMN
MAWWSRNQQCLPPARHTWPLALVIFTAILLWAPRLSSACPDVCSCSSGEVNCMEHKLRFVPDNLPANATSILLDYNHITALRNRTFVAQNGLRHLSLHSNLLVSIHCQALAGLSELQELDLKFIGIYKRRPSPLPCHRSLIV